MEPFAGFANGGRAAIYHENDPPEWTGPTGYYRNDYRAPIDLDEAVVWSPLHVHATTSYEPDTMFFSMVAWEFYPPPPNREYTLELLYVPEGVEGAPPVGTTWDVPVDGTFSIEIPTYRSLSSAGAYRFSFTMSAVPLSEACDFDEDEDVDLEDYTFISDCLSGPNAETIDPGCEDADLDWDGDVDLADVFGFQAAFDGGF